MRFTRRTRHQSTCRESRRVAVFSGNNIERARLSPSPFRHRVSPYYPAVASRIYVAYSGFYIAIAVFLASQIDGISVSVSDVLSMIVMRVGWATIALAG